MYSYIYKYLDYNTIIFCLCLPPKMDFLNQTAFKVLTKSFNYQFRIYRRFIPSPSLSQAQQLQDVTVCGVT